MGKVKVALICFDNPFLPPMEGGKRAMLTKIRSLLLDPAKYEVDIYLHNKQREGVADSFKGLDKLAHGIFQTSMNSSMKSAWSVYPICVNKRYSHEFKTQLKQKEYDIAIYEGEQVSKYRLEGTVNAKYHLIYMHDVESVYRAEVARSHSNFLLGFINYLESIRFKWIEKQICHKFDHCWFISKHECETFGQWMGAPEKCEYMPFPALEIVKEPVNGAKAQRMLYVGDLSIKHNYLSVEWFAKNVLPTIRGKCPNAELMVVGRISEEDAETLKKLGANVCGYVDDLDAVYNDAACIVAPVLYGAGVKVKIIDAIARGQIIVTTTKGVEGTMLKNGEHLLVEDNPMKTAEICVKIMQNRENFVPVSERGLAYISQEHTISHQAEIIDRKIELLMK